MKESSRPLEGLRILDFSTTIAGPHCSRLLADMGADVIKVESPEGDLMRSRPVQRDGASTMFGQLNAGKKSIVLDLKRPESIAAVKKLVAKVDILVENYRPGVMKRLGLDYPVLAALNPKLIYCAISGYGQTGPGAGRPAYAPVIHAATGYDMAHLFYQQGRERPDNCGIFVADYASGAYAMGAILAALHQRHTTGKGQMVDVSMFETLVGMLLGEVNRAQFDFEMPSRPMYGPIEAGDGYVMLATASERTFQDMATAAGRRDWLTDPRFEKYADRRMNWGLLIDELEQWSKKMTVKEVVAALEKHGVPCSPYLTVTEALQDPQVEHRGSLCTIEDSAGSYKSPAPPFRFSGSPLQSGPKVASLGADTKRVLAEAGLSSSEIEVLLK
ncbi:CaiB/BaiF CoA-transferase family protein [Reyranella sp.]|uniref:CaiB/BaiF CoA transferase family protein n=1 Tax=Reyranella sp. TaxID=1929291 RepID=UPI0011F5F4AA|nr:CaiB/BaiF CoA-transferase family protein [Reyranella sp.]TAJ89807.1 MAG: CoA transferase [Reyranella sp.]